MPTTLVHPLVPDVPRLAARLARLARAIVERKVPIDGARVHDDRAFLRVILRGELGGGEAYVAGEWDADDLVGFLRGFLRATSARGAESMLTRAALWPARLRHRARRRNDRDAARRNVHAHYDLGDAFYRLFLDDAMVYSCAQWAPGDDLAAAQRRKLARICDLAELRAGHDVLEIGCGWGALAIAAAHRGAHVTAITVSEAQAIAAARASVDVRRCDYRDVTGEFDRVLSVEMLEQVGLAQLPAFFATVARRLRPGGRAVIQTITMPDERAAAYGRDVDWMQTYIFPGTEIPSLGAIRAAASDAGLAIASVDEIGPDYAPTLRAWRERFDAHAVEVHALGFDEPFVRAWRLYLAFSEAAFAERTLGVAQLVLAR